MDRRHSDEIFGMLTGMNTVLEILTVSLLRRAPAGTLQEVRDGSLRQANGKPINENRASDASIFASSQFAISYLEGFWDRIEALMPPTPGTPAQKPE